MPWDPFLMKKLMKSGICESINSTLLHCLLQKSQHLRLLFNEQYMNSNRVSPKRVEKKKKKNKNAKHRRGFKTQTWIQTYTICLRLSAKRKRKKKKRKTKGVIIKGSFHPFFFLFLNKMGFEVYG